MPPLWAPPWLEPFAPDFRAAVSEALAAPAPRRVACFDADGTLWTEDIGEAFLRWLLAGPLEHLEAREPHVYERYEERVRQDLTAGYAWAVQLMAGLAETDVVRWARQLAAAWPTYRPEMNGLVRGLAEQGFEVWIVSASNSWMIEATARRLGLPEERVIGVRVELAGGRITDRIVEPMPCREGKVAAIRAVIGQDPLLAVGDGLGDLAMLETARHPLAVGLRTRPDAPLAQLARERGWPVHLF